MFCDSNYAANKETINIFGVLVAKLGGKILTCSSKTQRNVMLSSTEVEYVAISACAQEINFVSMLLEEMTEVQKPSVIY